MGIDLEGMLEKRLEVEKQMVSAKGKLDENEHLIRSLEQKRNAIQQALTEIREQHYRETFKKRRRVSETRRYLAATG